MKRGRPSKREEFRESILSALGGYEHPVTISSIKRLVDARRMRPCGWNTTRKYLNELVAERLVLRQSLPPSGGRRPLVIYVGRSRQNQEW